MNASDPSFLKDSYGRRAMGITGNGGASRVWKGGQF